MYTSGIRHFLRPFPGKTPQRKHEKIEVGPLGGGGPNPGFPVFRFFRVFCVFSVFWGPGLGVRNRQFLGSGALFWQKPRFLGSWESGNPGSGARIRESGVRLRKVGGLGSESADPGSRSRGSWPKVRDHRTKWRSGIKKMHRRHTRRVHFIHLRQKYFRKTILLKQFSYTRHLQNS